MLANFDAPAREECTANRVVSNTPQQHLNRLRRATAVFAAGLAAAERASDEEDGSMLAFRNDSVWPCILHAPRHRNRQHRLQKRALPMPKDPAPILALILVGNNNRGRELQVGIITAGLVRMMLGPPISSFKMPAMERALSRTNSASQASRRIDRPATDYWIYFLQVGRWFES